MPHDNPSLAEMLRTVGEFIDDLMPRLDGLDRYHARCARYLLDICSRELVEWARVPGADDARLRELCAAPDAAEDNLASALCARIRAGDFDQRMDELHAALTAHVVAKVQVSKPGYLRGEAD